MWVSFESTHKRGSWREEIKDRTPNANHRFPTAGREGGWVQAARRCSGLCSRGRPSRAPDVNFCIWV